MLEPEHAVAVEPAVAVIVVVVELAVVLAVVPAVAAVVAGSDFVVVVAAAVVVVAVVGEAVGDVVASAAGTYRRFKALKKYNGVVTSKVNESYNYNFKIAIFCYQLLGNYF